MHIHPTELATLVTHIEHQALNGHIPDYFNYLKALDLLEFHVLDAIEMLPQNHEIDLLRDRALRAHQQISARARANLDHLIHEICTRQLSPDALRQRFNAYAASVSEDDAADQPDYDLFDDFLGALFEVDYEPSETRRRTAEMYYQQPTPGRLVLRMINALPFTQADCFYDIGSGLGNVPLLVSLLTGTRAIGIEYEPTYVHYARCASQKLGIGGVEFRNLDAQDAEFSDGTIFFMYTPFIGHLLHRVMGKLHAIAQMHPITLCTYGPCTPIVEREGWLTAHSPAHGSHYRLAIFTSTES